MKITIPETEEYADILETLKDLPKTVRIKIVTQAIREYEASSEGKTVINLFRKRKRTDKKSTKDTKAMSSVEKMNPLKKIMGGFIE